MQTKTTLVPKDRPAPQIIIRSGVRSGGDIDTCEFNLNKWRERYYYWYDVAKKSGRI
jgi:hypothetical protein